MNNKELTIKDCFILYEHFFAVIFAPEKFFASKMNL